MKHLRSDIKEAAEMSGELQRREIRSEFLFSEVLASSWDSQISAFSQLKCLHFSVAVKTER